MRLTTMNLEEEHVQKFKEFAKEEQRTFSWYLRKVMADHIKSKEDKGKKK